MLAKPDLRQYVRELRKSGVSNPRVHPNGFLQLDLTAEGDNRLHIWLADDRLPKQSVRTAIHDHIFDMESSVVKGTLTNVLYVTDVGEDYEVWQVQTRAGNETKLGPTGSLVSAKAFPQSPINAGETYVFPAAYFHDTETEGDTVTIMRKKRYYPLYKEPRILVPKGERPDNSFSRESHDQRFLWGIIEEQLEI